MGERRVKITAGSVKADAVLDESSTAQAVRDALPLSIPGETWGDEIYIVGDPTVFKRVAAGTMIRIERA